MSFSSPEMLSLFLAGQKPRNLLICTKPLLKNKIGSQFFALSCICSCCSLFRSKEIPVKRVGIKSTVSLSELWTYASIAAAYSPRGLTSGVVRGWPMADLRARQNLLMPYPRDRQGGKYPTVARSRGEGLGAAGIDWCIRALHFAWPVVTENLSYNHVLFSACTVTQWK